MRIAILNYADVANFGDVLFPIIAEQELRSRLANVDITFFSPTRFTLGEFRSERYDRAALASFDAILMCGGEIVHREDHILRGIYARLGVDLRDHIDRPTDLVFDWTDLPVPFKAWVGIGMAPPSPRVARDVANAAATLDLIVARGEGTQWRLWASGVPADRIEIAPDLGWLIPRACMRREPDRLPVTCAQPYMVVHAMPQMEYPGALAAAADSLAAIQDRMGVDVVCLPLTTCWGDQETLERLADHAGGRFHLVDHRIDVLAKAGVLRNCAFYVGQSMHGFIGALAAGRPAGLNYPDLDDKFRELLVSLDAPGWRIGDWRALGTLVDRITTAPIADLLSRRARAAAAVDVMFDRLAERLREAVDPGEIGRIPHHAFIASPESSRRPGRANPDEYPAR